MSPAACAAALGSLDETVCGAPPLKALLVVTCGDAGLPLGRFAEFGTGDARAGGGETTEGPLGCAVARVLVGAMLARFTEIVVLVGAMT